MAHIETSGAVDTALRARALRDAAVACTATGVVGFALSGIFGLTPSFPARTAAFLALGLAALWPFLRAHRPYRALGPGSRVTLARAAIVAHLAGFIGESPSTAAYWWLVVTATAGALLDIVDGELARRTGMTSAFGARFDLETDAVMVAVLAGLAWQFDKTGAWFLLAGALRYGFVAAGHLIVWLARPLPPRRRRQTFCVVQIVASIVVLAPIIDRPLSTALTASAFALLCYSFTADVLWLHRHRHRPLPEGDLL